MEAFADEDVKPDASTLLYSDPLTPQELATFKTLPGDDIARLLQPVQADIIQKLQKVHPAGEKVSSLDVPLMAALVKRLGSKLAVVQCPASRPLFNVVGAAVYLNRDYADTVRNKIARAAAAAAAAAAGGAAAGAAAAAGGGAAATGAGGTGGGGGRVSLTGGGGGAMAAGGGGGTGAPGGAAALLGGGGAPLTHLHQAAAPSTLGPSLLLPVQMPSILPLMPPTVTLVPQQSLFSAAANPNPNPNPNPKPNPNLNLPSGSSVVLLPPMMATLGVGPPWSDLQLPSSVMGTALQHQQQHQQQSLLEAAGSGPCSSTTPVTPPTAPVTPPSPLVSIPLGKPAPKSVAQPPKQPAPSLPVYVGPWEKRPLPHYCDRLCTFLAQQSPRFQAPESMVEFKCPFPYNLMDVNIFRQTNRDLFEVIEDPGRPGIKIYQLRDAGLDRARELRKAANATAAAVQPPAATQPPVGAQPSSSVAQPAPASPAPATTAAAAAPQPGAPGVPPTPGMEQQPSSSGDVPAAAAAASGPQVLLPQEPGDKGDVQPPSTYGVSGERQDSDGVLPRWDKGGTHSAW